MTDQPQPVVPAAKPHNPVIRAVVDYAGPLAFFIVYRVTKDFLLSTGVLVGVSAVALAIGYATEKRIAPIPAFTGAMALVFGLLTLVFKDDMFLKVKPTFINLVLGGGLLIGWARGKSPLKYLLGDAIKLSEPGWRRLTFSYGLFFLFMAALNLVVWKTQSEANWVTFKTFGLPVLALVFSFTQVPGMMKDAKLAEAAIRSAETQD